MNKTNILELLEWVIQWRLGFRRPLPSPCSRLADVHAKRGKFPEAEKLYKDVLEVAPTPATRRKHTLRTRRGKAVVCMGSEEALVPLGLMNSSGVLGGQNWEVL